MSVPAGEVAEGFPGGAPEPVAVQEAGFINSRLAVVGAVASMAAILAPVTATTAEGSAAAVHPAGNELVVGDETSQPAVVHIHDNRPQMGTGGAERAHCFPSGASRYIKSRVMADQAKGIKVKPYGRITNIAHGKFTGPAFTPDRNTAVFVMTKYHLTDGKNFPPGRLMANFYYKYTKNGTTHVEKSDGFPIDESGC